MRDKDIDKEIIRKLEILTGSLGLSVKNASNILGIHTTLGYRLMNKNSKRENESLFETGDDLDLDYIAEKAGIGLEYVKMAYNIFNNKSSKITYEKLRKLIIEDGLTIAEVARQYKVSGEAMRCILVSYGIDKARLINKNKLKSERDEYIRNNTDIINYDLNTGMSIIKICEKHGLTKSDVREYIENGIFKTKKSILSNLKDRREEIISMYISGMTIVAIADEFGINRLTMDRYFTVDGLRKEKFYKRRTYLDIPRCEIEDMFLNRKMSIVEIANELGVKREYIYTRLRENVKIPKRCNTVSPAKFKAYKDCGFSLHEMSSRLDMSIEDLEFIIDRRKDEINKVAEIIELLKSGKTNKQCNSLTEFKTRQITYIKKSYSDNVRELKGEC